MIQKIFVNADGGARKNPGPAAIGVVICDENKNQLEFYKERIGDTTNNVAEYKALIRALQISANHTRGEVHVFMDSELVIKQMTGYYRIKAQHLLPLFQEAKNCERIFCKVVYHCVTRDNKFQVLADKLVNEALDGG
jgi:ribonuclease HI